MHPSHTPRSTRSPATLRSTERTAWTVAVHTPVRTSANPPTLTCPSISHSKVRSVLLERIHRRRRIEIIPNPINIPPLDPTALIANLHDHIRVRVSIANNHLNRRQFIIVLVHLHRRPHAVLQQLEQDVPQNARDIRERSVLMRVNLHRNRLPVLPIAHELRLLSTFNRAIAPTSPAASRRAGSCSG